MKRVKEDKHWSLMCPKKSPGLASCWGEKFEELYTKFVLILNIQIIKPISLDTSEKAVSIVKFLHVKFGRRSSHPRLRPAHHICSTRMHAIANQINKIWAQSLVPICAPRSSNTPHRMRLVYNPSLK